METKAKEIRSFILSAIRQRQRLMHEGRSHRNQMQMMAQVDHLSRYLNVYPHLTDVQTAKFFIRNKEGIALLLPGVGSKDHQARISRFNEISEICNQIINPQLTWDKPQQTKAEISPAR